MTETWSSDRDDFLTLDLTLEKISCQAHYRRYLHTLQDCNKKRKIWLKLIYTTATGCSTIAIAHDQSEQLHSFGHILLASVYSDLKLSMNGIITPKDSSDSTSLRTAHSITCAFPISQLIQRLLVRPIKKSLYVNSLYGVRSFSRSIHTILLVGIALYTQ